MRASLGACKTATLETEWYPIGGPRLFPARTSVSRFVGFSHYSRPDLKALIPDSDIWLSTKLAKARALAPDCLPAGKIAQASTGGNDQSTSTALTVLAFNSRANIHSDAIARPRSASTHSRTPTAVLR